MISYPEKYTSALKKNLGKREWAAHWDAYGREEFEVLIRIVKEVTAYRVQASLSPF